MEGVRLSDPGLLELLKVGYWNSHGRHYVGF